MKNYLPFAALLALLLIFYFPDAKSQVQVSYNYDNAGNRIERVIEFNVSEASLAETNNSDSKQKSLVYEEKTGEDKVIIYPNPTEGELKVEIQTTEKKPDIGFKLFDLSGSLLVSKSTTKNITKFDLSPYPLGTYILVISIGNKRTEWKIVKQ